MGEVSIIRLDLAKNVFQVHGAGADGSVVFWRKLSRVQLLRFLAEQPPCIVAMEACAAAHHWGRKISELGHGVRLIAPAYVKPFVKRQKNDAADADAIAEAALRPTMRFVAVKSVTKQAAGLTFKTRDLLVRQRTRAISALRGHLAEYGLIAPQGPAHLARLTSSTTFRTRNRRPQAKWSWTKSSDQRALPRASIRIGALVPMALRRALRLRTVSPSSL